MVKEKAVKAVTKKKQPSKPVVKKRTPAKQKNKKKELKEMPSWYKYLLGFLILRIGTCCRSRCQCDSQNRMQIVSCPFTHYYIIFTLLCSFPFGKGYNNCLSLHRGEQTNRDRLPLLESGADMHVHWFPLILVPRMLVLVLRNGRFPGSCPAACLPRKVSQ